ncbi:unnamed protein product [Psylliodes chrysocephalus]|uniref:Uncharacterized protein n=1 Tax=Psylliodes chrysocephalus TaxID=3402493 RepID=A0A9P0G971_9CUCU|nr:unnamed protein product [Psylliodes chrysocephala]
MGDSRASKIMKMLNKSPEDPNKLEFGFLPDGDNLTQVNFWALGDLGLQRSFIHACMRNVMPKYKYTNAERPRNANKAFYFTINEKPIRVCKTFFRNTLDITDRMIRSVSSKLDENGFLKEKNRGKHDSHPQLNEDLVQAIKNHINSIPRMESHYVRANTEHMCSGRDHMNQCLNSIFTNQVGTLCSYEGRKGNYKLKDTFIMKVLTDEAVEYGNNNEDGDDTDDGEDDGSIHIDVLESDEDEASGEEEDISEAEDDQNLYIHTFAPDRYFALIEKHKKYIKQVFSIEEWVDIVKKSNRKKTFVAVEISQDFYTFDELASVSLVGGKDISNLISNILRKTLSKELSLQFSGLGKKGKKNFSALWLYKVILAAVKIRYNDIDDTVVLKRTSLVLATSGDRDGGRKARSTKRNGTSSQSFSSGDSTASSTGCNTQLVSTLMEGYEKV